MTEQSTIRATDFRRPYRMRRRQTAIERTRERIVAAAFDLHATIGPSRTTIRAIAERAGVQRHTVYAHFPDVDALYEACTVHGIRATGMPDPGPWRAISVPIERLRSGLTQLIDWYRANERMLANVLADVDPGAPSSTPPDAFTARMSAIVEALAEPWAGEVAPGRRQVFDAVLGHALAFTTWRSLAAGGLGDDQVAAILVELVAASAAADA